jgi:AcrR family transcriptional regulator
MAYAQLSGRLMGDERKRHLLDVAARIIAESGLDAVTMERLAKEAGVSRALPYRYFPNSAAVIITLAEKEWAWIDDRVLTGMAGAESYQDRILAALRPYFDGLTMRGPAFGTLMIAPTSFEPLWKLHRKRTDEIAAFFTDMNVSLLGIDEETARAAARILLEASFGALQMAWQQKADREHLERVYMLIVEASASSLRRTARQSSTERLSARPSGQSRSALSWPFQKQGDEE